MFQNATTNVKLSSDNKIGKSPGKKRSKNILKENQIKLTKNHYVQVSATMTHDEKNVQNHEKANAIRNSP